MNHKVSYVFNYNYNLLISVPLSIYPIYKKARRSSLDTNINICIKITLFIKQRPVGIQPIEQNIAKYILMLMPSEIKD